ncbi:MAG TPA: hypothetical protein VF798_09040, partial [Burkholderiaceae bacterium]
PHSATPLPSPLAITTVPARTAWTSPATPSIDSAMVNTVQPALQKSARSELQQSIAQPAVQSVASPAQQPMAAAATSSLSLALEPVADAMPVKKAPSKSSGGYLDVAALKPRQVGIEDLGLEFYVPGAWKQTRSGKSLEFIDADGDLKLEAGGAVRSGRSVDQWLAMRVQTLAHDLPYMKQLGEAAPLEGEDWGDRVVARVVEFRGTAPGASEQQSCLLCCLRTDSVLASIVISADTDVFEANRALYKWLLPRANLAVREEDVIETDNVIDDGLQSHSSMVASGLRMILISALCNGVLLSQARGLHLFILLYVLVCAAGFGCFGLYRITQGLRFPTWAKVLFFIGMCLPVVSLILIVLLRWRARSFLREGGYGTRIWNLHEAIDNVNHDLRNTMAAALVLALPVYGMAHVAEKRLGLERKMVVFAAPDHSFSALMPESPTLKLGGPDGSDEQVWSGNAGGVAYNAGYTWITSTVEEPEQALRDFAKSRTRAMNWTMESSTDDEIEAHEARRVEATTANGDTVSAEYVLVEHRMFMFWVELPAKEKDGFKGEEFLESISLK